VDPHPLVAQPPERQAEPEPIEIPRLGEGAVAQRLEHVPFIKTLLPRLSHRAMMALTAVSVLTLLGMAWLFRHSGGILVLGGIVGVSVAARVPTARAALRPIAALGRAAAPLALILLVFLAAGTIESPPLLQLAVGLVTILVAWYGLIRSEWQSESNPLRGGDPTARASVRRGLQGVLVVALLSGVRTYAAIPALDALEETGETSAGLFLVAVALFVVAALLRLAGYATTRLRALVTIAIGLALARLASEYGVIPGYELLNEQLHWLTDELLLAVAGGAVVLVSLTEIVLTLDAARGLPSGPARVATLLKGPVLKRSITDYAAGLGLLASCLAALALLLAVIAAATVGGAKEEFDELTVKPIDPGQPARAPGALTDEELAERYSPVLVFTENQRWSPTKVDEYLARATMKDWKGQEVPAPPVDALPDDCPGIAPKPCYELTIKCESADDRCAMGREATVGEARHDEAAYVRVARRGSVADGSPNPFATFKTYEGRRERLIRSTTTLLQYWYFYPYDEWVAPVLGGQRLKQRHEADWEAVTVGLGDSGPLFVAYSEHCGGTWSTWDDIRVASTEWPRLHPLVAVAEGSQANYRVAEERRAPDWAKCAGVPADTLTLVSYASNIRDRTDSKWSWTPAEHLLVTAETPPMDFLGRWAPYSRTTLENFRQGQRLGRDGTGPATPTLQRLWQHPIETIFGGRNWRHE
jgi:hypothetical protein